NLTFTATYSGFVSGDTSSVLSGSPSLMTTATATSPVGSYTIAAAQGNLSASNYTFSFTNGTLSVTPTPVTVSVTAATKPYDPTTSATLSCSVTGGLISPDTSTCTAAGSFADANAGNSKTMNITSVTVSNANYKASPVPTTTTANI